MQRSNLAVVWITVYEQMDFVFSIKIYVKDSRWYIDFIEASQPIKTNAQLMKLVLAGVNYFWISNHIKWKFCPLTIKFAIKCRHRGIDWIALNDISNSCNIALYIPWTMKMKIGNISRFGGGWKYHSKAEQFKAVPVSGSERRARSEWMVKRANI